MSKKVSVVIPTLGGSQIIKTLNQLNKGSLRPNEIILSTIGKIKLQNEVNYLSHNVFSIFNMCLVNSETSDKQLEAVFLIKFTIII